MPVPFHAEGILNDGDAKVEERAPGSVMEIPPASVTGPPMRERQQNVEPNGAGSSSSREYLQTGGVAEFARRTSPGTIGRRARASADEKTSANVGR